MVKKRKTPLARNAIIGVGSLKICHWNICGINSNVYGSKCGNDIVQGILSKFDIVGLTETHANDNTDIYLPGFYVTSVTRPRSKCAKRNSGGVAILIREYLRPLLPF